MIRIAENRYGKSRVRLMKVTRHQDRHELAEWSIELLLQGDFEAAHTTGDNSKILPTDTMKNTVYFIANQSKAESMEQYAQELIDFILSRNSQVQFAEVTVESSPWRHLKVDGELHPTAFIHGSEERQTTHVYRRQSETFHVHSGFRDLVILKSSKSGFENYIVDELTTLKPAADRIFATACKAQWVYAVPTGDFSHLRRQARESLLKTFAHHESKSVQQTLYAMAEAALEAVPQLAEITLTMPNKHALLVDLSRFGQQNDNEIFVPTDEPHGTIEARVVRG
jgi:urate oxidase